MEDNKRLIKVLWIDDNPTQFDEFLDDAHDEGLDITVFQTVEAGLKELENRNAIYEALILDANCKIADEETEVPQLVALSHAIVGLYVRDINLPWFVYTGGSYDGKEALEHLIPQQYRKWDERQWYNKPDDEYELFAAIKSAVAKSEDHKLMEQFPEAFDICKSQELLDLLRKMNTHDFERDETAPNSLRCVADEVCDFLRDNGIFVSEFTSSNHIKECSILFGTDKNYQYVPIYIQNSLRSLSDYCNAGSHQSENKNKVKPNKVRADIKAGNAKYLNRAAIHSLMNVILWAHSFPIDDQEAMKEITNFFLERKSEQERKNRERNQQS